MKLTEQQLDFAQAEIRRPEKLRLEALDTRIDADLLLGGHPEVIPELSMLHAEHPARERLASQLMLALYRAGRQRDALEVYQRTRTHLAEELGLDPGPGLKALQSEIREQADSLVTSAPAGVPLGQHARVASLPQPATRTVARDFEIESLSRLLRGSGLIRDNPASGIRAAVGDQRVHRRRMLASEETWRSRRTRATDPRQAGWSR